MAGKSNKARNRKRSNSNAAANANSSQLPSSPDASVNDVPVVVEPEPATTIPEANGNDSGGDSTSAVTTAAASEVTETESTNSSDPPRQGELHLYPVSVKTLGGEKLDLQLNPGDSVMDVRQFLLDAPETCFFTCYDLLLHSKDGSVHHLEDYNEISEVADITVGGCSLEMVAGNFCAYVEMYGDLTSNQAINYRVI